jgi:hypothetical protein
MTLAAHATQFVREVFVTTHGPPLSRSTDLISKMIFTHQPPDSNFILPRFANQKFRQTQAEWKFYKTEQNQIPASDDKMMANQTEATQTGQSKFSNQPKQRNHSHQLNMTTQAKKRAFSQVSAVMPNKGILRKKPASTIRTTGMVYFSGLKAPHGTPGVISVANVNHIYLAAH